MKKIIKILNTVGLYTQNQLNDITEENNRLKKEIKELRIRNNNDKFLINELKKSNKSLPFEFDYLIGIYTKDQINALVYKLINYVRNNIPYRELLSVWNKRINNAMSTIESRTKGTIED